MDVESVRDLNSTVAHTPANMVNVWQLLSNLRNAQASWGVESPQYLAIQAIVHDEILRLQTLATADKPRSEGEATSHARQTEDIAKLIESLRL